MEEPKTTTTEKDGTNKGFFRRALAYITAAILGAVKPPPAMRVSEWADCFRWLTRETSTEWGPWRTARTPYLREPMDTLSEWDPTETVVLLFGSQLGKSEVGNNWIGYLIHLVGGPIMMVQPSIEAARKYAQQRLSALFVPTYEDGTINPVGEKLTKARVERDAANRVLYREFSGGVLHIVGAEATSGLASSPVRSLFCDEVDRWVRSAGREGSPLQIVTKRTNAFPNRKRLITSTPTIAGESVIEVEFLKTDLRFYHVPCPHCTDVARELAGYQVLRFSRVDDKPGCLVFDEDRPETPTAYECAHCAALIDESSKTFMLENGEWRPGGHDEWTRTRRVNDREIVRDPKAAGFHLSTLYSPWFTWNEVRDAFLSARHDPVELQTFINTILAELWEPDRGEGVKSTPLMGRREDTFGEGNKKKAPAAPRGVGVLTAGVDVQADRVELEVVGWGRGEESWSVDYVIINGDTSKPAKGEEMGEVWKELDKALSRTYTHGYCGSMKISAACIDTGHEAQRVYEFVKSRQKSRVWGIKGRSNTQQIRHPVWPAKPGKNNKGRIDLYLVGVDEGKSHVYARLRIPEPGPGYCHFPLERGEDYFRQLTSETLRVRPVRNRVVREWHLKKGRRNEALDTRVYAYAALQGWIAQRHTIENALDNLTPVMDNRKSRPRDRESRRGFFGTRRKSFISR